MLQNYLKSCARFPAAILSVVILQNCVTKNKITPASVFPVAGTITQTSSYCGGARPTEEILEEYNKPKPYGGKTLYITGAATKELVSKLQANDTGYFKISLPPGKYAIWQDEQMNPLSLSPSDTNKMVVADSTCLRKWWNTPLQIFEVVNAPVQLQDVNFHHPCFVSGDIPCLRYVGPMPP